MKPDTIRYITLQATVAFGLVMAAEAAYPAAQTTVVAAAPGGPTPTLAQPASARTPFVVRILPAIAEPRKPESMFVRQAAFPRPDGGADAAATARLEKYHQVLVEKLHAVPGLVLGTGKADERSALEEAAIKLGVSKGIAGLPPVEYEISLRLGADWHGVDIEAMRLQNQPGPKVLWRTSETPDAILNTPRLTALWELRPENPDRDMESLVLRMQLTLFPRDPVLLDKLMSELLDPQLESTQRRMALNDLISADSRRDSFGNGLPPQVYRPDPAMLRAATEVATTASDAALRLNIWYRLSGIGIPRIDPAVLVAPAERALGSESDQRVQLALVSILSIDLKNERARAALNSVAVGELESDRPELVRMAARRVLNDNADWSDYFVSKLGDPRVTDAERVDLINYVYSVTGFNATTMGGASMKLEKADERSLANLMKKQGATEVALAAVGLLRSAGGSVANEEFIDYLRSGTGLPLADSKVRTAVLSALAFGLKRQPDLRPLFEDVVARDLDPVLRVAAQQALDQTK